MAVVKQQATKATTMDGTVAPSPSQLQQLPAELRNQIYELVLEQETEVIITTDRKEPGIRMRCGTADFDVLALTRVSRIVRSETLALFFDINCFTYDLEQCGLGEFSRWTLETFRERMERFSQRIKSITRDNAGDFGSFTVDIGSWDVQESWYISEFGSNAQSVASIVLKGTDDIGINQENVYIKISFVWASTPDYNEEIQMPVHLCGFESNAALLKYARINEDGSCRCEVDDCTTLFQNTATWRLHAEKRHPDFFYHVLFDPNFEHGVVKLDVPLRASSGASEERLPFHTSSPEAYITHVFATKTARLMAHPVHTGCYIDANMNELLLQLSKVETGVEEAVEAWGETLYSRCSQT